MTKVTNMFQSVPPDGVAALDRQDGDGKTGKPICPVPDGVEPSIPSNTLGKPSAVYEYRDAQGLLQYCVCRWDRADGKKIRPLSYWENAYGAREWKFKAVPDRRSLYRLDRLAQSAETKVLIVEGEKAVHAAERLFHEYTVITSSGGAKGANKTDWSPLAGREVIIWPDQDEAGRSYAGLVASLVQGVGANSLSIVEVPETWPQGWDLADPLPEKVTSGRLLSMLEGAPPWVPYDNEANIPHKKDHLLKDGELIDELNSEHAVLLQEGGKTLVLSWEGSELEQNCEIPVLQTFRDFRNRYLHRSAPSATSRGVRRKPLGQWWLEHPNRREYLGLRFLPGKEQEIGGYLNLWRGFSVKPQAGSWNLMKQHVETVLANGVSESGDYILKWSAWTIQNPDRPAEVALVLKGARGSGKGTFARAMKHLFGQHGLQVVSPAQLTGRFNSHLRDCCLLFADEAIAPGDKTAESVLKGLITEPQLVIEGKGLNAIQVCNRLHIVMASNESWVVPAGLDERRFAVFEVSDSVAQDQSYFAAISDEMKNGGLAAMLHELQSMDLGNWHPRQDVPQTDALREQKAKSLRGFDRVFLDLLSEGVMPGLQPGDSFIATTELQDYAHRTTGRRTTLIDVTRLLGELGFERRTSGRPRGFVLPSLTEAREAWDNVKTPVSWNDASEWISLDASVRQDDIIL